MSCDTMFVIIPNLNTCRVPPWSPAWTKDTGFLRFRNRLLYNLKILLLDLPADSDIHERSAKTEVEVTALSQMEAELQSKIAKGENIGPGSSLMKNIASMLGQQIAALRLEGMAYYGIPHNNLLWLNGKEGVGIESSQTAIGSYLNTRASSIYGGSREVQKNIIAKTVLGL